MASGNACHTFALNQAVLVVALDIDTGIVGHCQVLSRIVWKFSAAYHASVHQG